MPTAALPEDFAPLPLQVQDELWLNMDRPNNLMVIDSLVWLQQEPDWKVVRGTVAQRLIEAYPVFRCHPETIKGRSFWVRDPDFRLSRHVRRVRLTGEVDEERVRRYLSAQRSKPFDRAHPLWSAVLIPDVRRPDGQLGAVFILRVHHAIADGIRMTELALGLCDPAERSAAHTIGANVGRGHEAKGRLKPVASTLRAGRRSLSRVGENVIREVRDPLGAPGRAVTSTFGLLSAAANEATGLIASPGAKSLEIASYVAGQAPGGTQTFNTVTETVSMFADRSAPQVWAGTPGVPKDAVWSSPLPLEEIKRIGRAAGMTVNDVVLGAVAGALRSYLIEHGEEPHDIGWLMPVSVLPYGEGMPKTLGNHFALVKLSLPVAIADPVERLREVHRRTDRIKNSQETLLTFTAQRVVAQSPERVSVALTNYFANLTLGVLTNVPGPREPVTFAGVLVDAMLGWAPASGNQALTIAIYSYAGQVYIGIGSDRTLIPDADRLVDLLEQQFA
ncbi:WS/DGAT domain-containing protein [Calidifontibacter terrae]